MYFDLNALFCPCGLFMYDQLQVAGRRPGWLASPPGLAGADGKNKKQAFHQCTG
jgi:hypothetical protein